MDELLRIVERALKSRGWSARQASMAAVDNPHLIANMRRGQIPSVDRVQALCEVLELEFYIGPKRSTFTVDEERLALALETAERGLSRREPAMHVAQKAQLVAAVYELIGAERGPANAARLQRLIDVMAGDGREGGGVERVVRMARERTGGGGREGR